MTRLEEHLDVVESACVALDGVEEYGIWQGDASGLLVLHGLAMYARDTARSAECISGDAALARLSVSVGVAPDMPHPLILLDGPDEAMDFPDTRAES